MRYRQTIADEPTPTEYQAGPGQLSALLATPIASLSLAVLAVLAGLLLELDWRTIGRWALVALGLPVALLAAIALSPLLKGIIVAAGWLFERAVQVDVTGDGVIGRPEPETIRLLPVRGAPPAPVVKLSGSSEPGYTERDLGWLLARAYTSGHSTRALIGQTLPSGRRIETGADLAEFYDILETAELLEGRGPRTAGRLVGTLAEARAALQLR